MGERGGGGGGRKELVFRRKEYEAWERVGDYFNASKEKSNDVRLERFGRSQRPQPPKRITACKNGPCQKSSQLNANEKTQG